MSSYIGPWHDDDIIAQTPSTNVNEFYLILSSEKGSRSPFQFWHCPSWLVIYENDNSNRPYSPSTSFLLLRPWFIARLFSFSSYQRTFFRISLLIFLFFFQVYRILEIKFLPFSRSLLFQKIISLNTFELPLILPVPLEFSFYTYTS